MNAAELAEALRRQRRAVAPGMLVIPGPKADQIIAALDRAQRVEAAAREACREIGLNEAHAALVRLTEALAPAPGEEGKG